MGKSLWNYLASCDPVIFQVFSSEHTGPCARGQIHVSITSLVLHRNGFLSKDPFLAASITSSCYSSCTCLLSRAAWGQTRLTARSSASSLLSRNSLLQRNPWIIIVSVLYTEQLQFFATVNGKVRSPFLSEGDARNQNRNRVVQISNSQRLEMKCNTLFYHWSLAIADFNLKRLDFLPNETCIQP